MSETAASQAPEGDGRLPERFDPAEMEGEIAAEHLARYRLAARLVEGREVLDAACGVGYGTRMLAAAGTHRVVGLDASPEAISIARRRVGEEPVELVVGDLRDLPLEAASFDAVVCFEAIEHVEGPERALDELRRVLRAEGILILSSPNREVYAQGNPHHVHEFTPQELRGELRRRFRNVRLLRQKLWTASSIMDDRALATLDGELETTIGKAGRADPGDEVYTVALASDAELPEPPATTVLTRTEEIAELQERLRATEKERARAQAALRAAEQDRRTLRQSVERLRGSQERLRTERDAADEGRRELARVLGAAHAEAEALHRMLDRSEARSRAS